jgi:thiol:disulfide interchange protein
MRKLLSSLALLAALFIAAPAVFMAAPALAFEVIPYAKSAAEAAIASGKPVLLEVYASWCPTCQAQHEAVLSMKDEAAYRNFAVFQIDFDGQKDVVKALKVPRSTLILYKGGKEITRESWGATKEDVARVLMMGTK